MFSKITATSLTEQSQQQKQGEEDPMSTFLYALKAAESKRQYPRRLKVFLDYLKLEGHLEQQAKELLTRGKQSPRWLQSCLMQFITFQKERVGKGEITYSTIGNYYKATKLFIEMNTDAAIVNWKKISRGLLLGEKLQMTEHQL